MSGLLDTVETLATLLPCLGAWRVRTCYLQFSPGVELLQAVHGLLSVHAGGHGGPVLEGVGKRSVSRRQTYPRAPQQGVLWLWLASWGNNSLF